MYFLVLAILDYNRSTLKYVTKYIQPLKAMPGSLCCDFSASEHLRWLTMFQLFLTTIVKSFCQDGFSIVSEMYYQTLFKLWVVLLPIFLVKTIWKYPTVTTTKWKQLSELLSLRPTESHLFKQLFGLCSTDGSVVPSFTLQPSTLRLLRCLGV